MGDIEREGAGTEVLTAPKEFRIFPAGVFMTDDGPHRLTLQDAQALVDVFNARGNAMCIDHDHGTTSLDAPPENRKAAGWIHRLDVRGSEADWSLDADIRGDAGVWANEIEWDPEVETWITSDPPKIRYVSPWYAFKMDGELAVPTMINNVAVTNNPKTWHCWRLASQAVAAVQETGMNDTDLLGAGKLLLALLALMGASDERWKSLAAETDAKARELLGDQADAAMQIAANDAAPMSAPGDALAGMGGDDAKNKTQLPAAAAAAVVDNTCAVDPNNPAANATQAAAGSDLADTNKLEDQKAIASRLASILSTEVRSASDRAAISGLIETNKTIIPAHAIPLLHKASLADAVNFVNGLRQRVKLPAKSPLAPKAQTTTPTSPVVTATASQATTAAPKRNPQLETRAASLATKHSIKDPARLLRYLENPSGTTQTN